MKLNNIIMFKTGDILEISFKSLNKTSIDDDNGMTFTLNDGETVPITCVSKGGNPKPMMHIYKEADDISGLFDQKVFIFNFLK